MLALKLISAPAELLAFWGLTRWLPVLLLYEWQTLQEHVV